ncbi:putative mitochondrial protein, conserved [Xylographa carneopallida]|nr:putative mitochondrial protein, conserved [Xylographa carneopallida]
MRPFSQAQRSTTTSIRRLLSITTRLRAQSPFGAGPAPPRLPENEQKLYEQLQKSSTGAFSTPKPIVIVNQSPAAPSLARSKPQVNQSPNTNSTATSPSDRDLAAVDARVRATGDGEELHPDIRRGMQPEFEGERNPKTGEIGGPKNEPLRWGGNVDWSYNGRVTDF